MATPMNKADFLYHMTVNGACVFPQVVPPALCERMKAEAMDYYAERRPVQIAAGMAKETEWGMHHTCGKHDSFHTFLDAAYLDSYISAYFDDKPYILNGISSLMNPPATLEGKYEHGHNWHRDVRTYVGQGNRQLLIALLMLDDFTEQNGATNVLFGTHRHPDFPPEDFVARETRLACGPQGSIVLLDGDVWHRTGLNTTDKPRFALSCVLTRPFFKQQLDYPRFFDAAYAESLSPHLRQLFGFNARTPTNIEEWYQHPAHRFYQPNQEKIIPK